MAKGCRVWDLDGKEYIDCTSQSWALYLGYCNQEVWEAVNQHAQRLTHVHQGFDTLPRFALAKRITQIMPSGMNRVSFVPTSALALEGAMKLALKNRPGAANFLCLWDSYHGTTLGTMGASWIATQSNGRYIGGSRFLPLTRQFVRAPNPYCYRCYFGREATDCDVLCAKMLELTIQKSVNGPPAGLLMEPLQASGGQLIFPRRYVEAVREICDRYQVPLIFDEIQTFARMGTWTAAEYYGVTPDFIVLGKAIGGGLPLGVTIIKDGLQGYEADSEELHTFANNSLSQVASLKLLEIIQRDDVLGNVRRMGDVSPRGSAAFAARVPGDGRHTSGRIAYWHRVCEGPGQQGTAGRRDKEDPGRWHSTWCDLWVGWCPTKSPENQAGADCRPGRLR